MPNASKYIIDVANIRPGGNPIKGLYVGSSEKKYATLGNKCIYDKVFYELSVDNITNVEPNAQTVTISSYTSKRTHGNGVVDTLYINPSTKQVTANTSTANTKDTTVVVNQALTLNGATTGTGVTVTITQIKDYPTGLTLTISPKSTIPAAGGSISSSLTNYTYSVKANYKSGNNNVDVTSDSNTTITANVTGVTAASKGTTASNVTTAGTITFTAKYVCNGKTVTTTAAVNITQDKNEVVSYANPTFTLTPSSNQTLPASGGRVTASVSDVQQVRTWSSTSTDTFTPSYTTEWNARTISCNSRGTVTGDTLTLGTTTATVTANGKSTTKSYVVYQQANAVTNSNTNPFGYTVSVSIGDGLTAAGGSATVTASASHKAYNTYTSTAVDTTAHSVTDTSTISITTNGNNRFSLNGNTLSHSNMTTNLATDTVVITAKNSSNTSTTATDTKDIINTRQKEDNIPSNYVATISIGNGITAAGGSATVTASASHTNTYTWAYTSGSKQTGQTESVSDTANVTEDSDPNNRFSYSNGTLTHSSMGTTATTDTCTLRVRNASSTATTNIASVSVQNKIESYNTTDTNYMASVSIGNGLTAAGGSATVTASGSHTHTSTPVYTSGMEGATSTTYPSDGATWSITTNGNNRFTINGNTLNHSSMGTTATTDTVVVTAANNNSATATATDRKDISNGYTDSWNNPVVTFNPASLSFTSGASSQNITASATQSGTRTFDSTSTSSLSNSDFTWSWNKGSSDTWITIGAGDTATKSITVTANSGNARSGSVTATATGDGSKTGSKSASVEQARKESEEEGPFYGQLDISQVTLSCNDVPASGGTVYPSWEGTVKQYYYYTKDGVVTTTGWTSITPTVTWSPTGKTGNNLGQTEKARTSLGDCTATFTGNSSKTATKAITVYQEANTYTDSWNDPVVKIGANPSNVITYSAQTVVLTAAATQSGTRAWTSKASTDITNTDFTWTWTTEDITGFSSSVNNNVCTVTASANDSTSNRYSKTYEVVAKGADDKTGKDGMFILQKRKSTLTPKIISISATVTNNNPPTPKYKLDIRSDTQNMLQDIRIGLASGNSTSYIYKEHISSAGSTSARSFSEEFSASSVPIYLYVKMADGQGSCNMSVSATNSLFNMSARTVGESEWAQIGGGDVSLDTSSITLIVLTFNRL